MGICGSRPVPIVATSKPEVHNLVIKEEAKYIEPKSPKIETPIKAKAPERTMSRNSIERIPTPERVKSPDSVLEISEPIPEIKEEAHIRKFECDNGHELIWHTDIPFHYMKITETPMIECSRCKIAYSSAGWHCRECLYDLCENCSLEFDKPRQFMKCEEQHELFWSPETVGIYKENSPSSVGFRCNGCKKALIEPNWHCDHCSYDICIACGIKNGFKPPLNLLVCDKEHVLKQMDVVQEEADDYVLGCNLCSAVINDRIGFHCGECTEVDFDICLKCANKSISNMIPHPLYKCKEGKQLLLLDNLPAIRQESGEDCKCCSCGKENMNKAFICLDCCQCYCLKCSKKLYQSISALHKMKCENGHQLSYSYVSKYDSKRFKCNICNELYGSGCFCCNACNFYVCIKDIQSY